MDVYYGVSADRPILSDINNPAIILWIKRRVKRAISYVPVSVVLWGNPWVIP